MRAATGQQFHLSLGSGLGEVTATIAQLSAALRGLTVGGIELTQPYPADIPIPFGNGAVLVPWPNRVEDGVWTLDGQQQQLDITEPARNNALHGLLRDTPYTVVEQSAEAVTLAATVHTSRGYPFLLDTTVRYALTADGVTVTHELVNGGAARAPFGVGTHPFLKIGGVPTADLVLSLAAETFVDVDERLNPIAERAVAGTPYDLRSGVRVADLDVDTAYADIAPTGGLIVQRLVAPDGRSVELWQEPAFPYSQIFTTRRFPQDGGFVTAIAVEPMTALPNALNTGRGLLWLEPGARWSASWGIRYSTGL